MLIVPDPILHGGSPTLIATREFAAAWNVGGECDEYFEMLERTEGVYPDVPMVRYECAAGVAEVLFGDGREPVAWYSPAAESGALLVQAGLLDETPEVVSRMVDRIPVSAWRPLEGSIVVPESPISFYAYCGGEEAIENSVEPPLAPGEYSVEWANLEMEEDYLNALRFRPLGPKSPRPSGQ